MNKHILAGLIRGAIAAHKQIDGLGAAVNGIRILRMQSKTPNLAFTSRHRSLKLAEVGSDLWRMPFMERYEN